MIGMQSGSGTRECITLSMQTGASTCNRNKNAWECIHDHRIMYLTQTCTGTLWAQRLSTIFSPTPRGLGRTVGEILWTCLYR